MALEHKVKGVMNVRDEVMKQMGFVNGSGDNSGVTMEWELIFALMTLAVCTREITIDTVSVDAFTYTER